MSISKKSLISLALFLVGSAIALIIRDYFGTGHNLVLGVVATILIYIWGISTDSQIGPRDGDKE